MYQQCKLKKGSATRICWIPKKYAKIGSTLKLKINGEWDNGWLVVRKYAISDNPTPWRR